VLNAAAWREINEEVVEVVITGYAKRGFSGDLDFRRDGWQVSWSHDQFFSTEPFVGQEAVKGSIERARPAFTIWTEQDGGILHISLKCGKITAVRIRNSRTNPTI
jgi:hypothetical protein